MVGKIGRQRDWKHWVVGVFVLHAQGDALVGYCKVMV